MADKKREEYQSVTAGNAAQAALSAFARLEGVPPVRLTTRAGLPAEYDRDSRTLYMPQLPATGLPWLEREILLAYLVHEAWGEVGQNTWTAKLGQETKRDGATLAAIGACIGDVYINSLALQQWPGAGMAIRDEERGDVRKLKKSLKLPGASFPVSAWTMGWLAKCLWAGLLREGELDELFEDHPEVLRRLPAILKVVDEFDPARNKDDVIAASRALYDALDVPPEEQEQQGQGEGGGGEGEPSEDGEEGKGEGQEGEGQEGSGEGEGEGKGEGQGQPKDGQGKPSDGKGEDANPAPATDKPSDTPPKGRGASKGGGVWAGAAKLGTAELGTWEKSALTRVTEAANLGEKAGKAKGTSASMDIQRKDRTKEGVGDIAAMRSAKFAGIIRQAAN